MVGQYVEDSKKKIGSDSVLLSNGDIVHAGGVGTIFDGQWFYYHKATKYTRRLPKATNMQEALEEYQDISGNCII